MNTIANSNVVNHCVHSSFYNNIAIIPATGIINFTVVHIIYTTCMHTLCHNNIMNVISLI